MDASYRLSGRARPSPVRLPAPSAMAARTSAAADPAADVRGHSPPIHRPAVCSRPLPPPQPPSAAGLFTLLLVSKHCAARCARCAAIAIKRGGVASMAAINAPQAFIPRCAANPSRGAKAQALRATALVPTPVGIRKASPIRMLRQPIDFPPHRLLSRSSWASST